MIFNSYLKQKAREILGLALEKGCKIATAESCSGGLIAGLLTENSGASDVFERGFVTYSNLAKAQQLGIDLAKIEEHGAVSESTAFLMVQGALKNSAADLAVAVTGIAGPGGGGDKKPVGLVYIAIAGDGFATKVRKFNFAGDRAAVREATILAALSMVEGELRRG